MQLLRDRHEVVIAEQDQRGAVGDAELDRGERVLDGRRRRPSEDAAEEAAQRGLVLDHDAPPVPGGTTLASATCASHAIAPIRSTGVTACS